MWSKVRRVILFRFPLRFFSTDPKTYSATKTRTAYKPPSAVNTIIKSNTNQMLNQKEKDHFHSFVKEAASGLHHNFARESAKVKSETRKFVKDICHTLDQTSLSLFIRHLDELQKNLQNPELKITPNSFMSFLDRLKHIGASQETINVVLRHLGTINIKALNKHDILKEYQKVAQESKAEEQLRLHEIRQFADDVVPRSRFIFDNYNLQPEKAESSSATTSSAGKEVDRPSQYFSFFQGERKSVRPEENFKNVEEMMSFLPLDYYVLLEDGYERVQEAEPPRSRYIYFRNLPLLYRKRSVFNSYKIYRAVFGDVLTPSFFNSPHFSLQPSIDIMKYSLELYFGKVRYHRVLNFSQESLKKRVEKLKSDASQENLQDQITQFENLYASLFEREVGQAAVEYNESEANFSKFSALSQSGIDANGRLEFQAKSFEELLRVVASNWEGDERRIGSDTRNIEITSNLEQSYAESLSDQRVLSLLKKRNKATPNIIREMKNDLNFKVRQRYGLDKPILANGVLEFESYEAKLKMLQSPLYKFGLYHFFNNIEFFDCDFANVLQIKTTAFEKRTLGECMVQINEMLHQGGYLNQFDMGAGPRQVDYLTLGRLKHYPDFRLGDIQIQGTQPIILRFKSFTNAYRALVALVKVAKKQEGMDDLKITMQTPNIRYYGGQFQTQFEKCIKDRFEGLEHTIKMRSDYVEKLSKDAFGENHSITEEFYEKMQEAQKKSDAEGGGPILSQRKLREFFPEAMEPYKKELTTPRLTRSQKVSATLTKMEPKEEKKEESKAPQEKKSKVTKKTSTERSKGNATQPTTGEDVGRSKKIVKKKQ